MNSSHTQWAQVIWWRRTLQNCSPATAGSASSWILGIFSIVSNTWLFNGTVQCLCHLPLEHHRLNSGGRMDRKTLSFSLPSFLQLFISVYFPQCTFLSSEHPSSLGLFGRRNKKEGKKDRKHNCLVNIKPIPALQGFGKMSATVIQVEQIEIRDRCLLSPFFCCLPDGGPTR